MAKAKFDRLERAIARLKSIPDDVQFETQKAIDINGDILVKAMKRYAPYDEGDLRESIVYYPHDRPDKLGGRIIAGNEKAIYAPMVEFGTPRQVAQPFFFTTFRLFRKRLKSRRSRAVRKGINKALGK